MTTFSDLCAWITDAAEPRQFWWRDDDTGADAGALQDLLSMRRQLGIPLVVSVVPSWLSDDCARILANEPAVFVAQHGWNHADRSHPSQKSIELGGTSDAACVLENLRQGADALRRKGLPRLLPLLVPPWNRVADDVLAGLGSLGIQSVSTFVYDKRGVRYGLRHINCHIDPIVWRGGKRLMSERELVDVTVRQMEREGRGPIGLLTHHLEMNDEAYDRVAGYLSSLAGHPLVDFVDPKDMFGDAR